MYRHILILSLMILMGCESNTKSSNASMPTLGHDKDTPPSKINAATQAEADEIKRVMEQLRQFRVSDVKLSRTKNGESDCRLEIYATITNTSQDAMASGVIYAKAKLPGRSVPLCEGRLFIMPIPGGIEPAEAKEIQFKNTMGDLDELGRCEDATFESVQLEFEWIRISIANSKTIRAP